MLEVKDWINSYTAIITKRKELAVGDTVTIPSKDKKSMNFKQKARVKKKDILGQRKPTQVIHYQNDTLSAKVTDIGNTYCVVEVLDTPD